MIKRIDEIEIANVRGIGSASYNVGFIPNKPTLIVAPNGFGKSSIATAFDSLNSKRLDLDKDFKHKGDETLKPMLKVKYTAQGNLTIDVEANAHKNEISEAFDIHVINSQLVSKAKKLKITGTTIVTSSIEVQPVVLIKKIPAKEKLPYSYSTAKKDFGQNGKVLPNISVLLVNHQLMARIGSDVDFAKSTQKGHVKVIDAFKEKVNKATGSTGSILANTPQVELEQVLAVPHIKGIVDAMQGTAVTFQSEFERALAALQVAQIYSDDRSSFRRAADYSSYWVEKKAYEQAFSSLKETWKNISPKETKDGLVVNFPKANQISNGERDIICFVAQLKNAKLKFREDKCILIIDEIFDYLDDANLVACQYYLTQMISEMKAEGRQIFPLILTHLNPGFFRNFTFSDQKVCYLNKSSVKDRNVERVIIKRSEKSIEDPISKYFLHFHNEDQDLSTEFQALNLPLTLAESSSFAKHCDNNLQQYLAGKTYDPLAVCCAVRRHVEGKTYHMLTPSDMAEFLTTHTTNAKLEFAQSKGVNVPEVYFLLGVIYNDALHLRENQDNFSALSSKLSNQTIKHMISNL